MDDFCACNSRIYVHKAVSNTVRKRGGKSERRERERGLSFLPVCQANDFTERSPRAAPVINYKAATIAIFMLRLPQGPVYRTDVYARSSRVPCNTFPLFAPSHMSMGTEEKYLFKYPIESSFFKNQWRVNFCLCICNSVALWSRELKKKKFSKLHDSLDSYFSMSNDAHFMSLPYNDNQLYT